MSQEIDIFRCLDFLRDNAKPYAQAKAERVYLEEFRKSMKASLMKEAEVEGIKTAALQEREAYSHADYIHILVGLREAVEREETLRWQLVAAQVRIDTWRSLESSKRQEGKNV